MPRLSNAIASGVLVAALALSGCGDSSSSATSHSPEIVFGSRVIPLNQKIPIRYTCDGIDISPPLEWGAVPSETKELVILLSALKPVTLPGQGKEAQLVLQWTVAGLQPTLHELPEGKLPPGAIVGRTKSGQHSYSVCPTRGTGVDYLFRIYALSRKLSLRHGFASSTLFRQAGRSALVKGEFVAGYTRA